MLTVRGCVSVQLAALQLQGFRHLVLPASRLHLRPPVHPLPPPPAIQPPAGMTTVGSVAVPVEAAAPVRAAALVLGAGEALVAAVAAAPAVALLGRALAGSSTCRGGPRGVCSAARGPIGQFPPSLHRHPTWSMTWMMALQAWTSGVTTFAAGAPCREGTKLTPAADLDTCWRQQRRGEAGAS